MRHWLSGKSLRARFYRELLVFGLIMMTVGGTGLLRVYFWGLEDATRLSYMDVARSVSEGEIPDDVLKHHWPENNPQVWRSLADVSPNILMMFPENAHRENVLMVQYQYPDRAVTGEPSEGFTFNVARGVPSRIHFFLRCLLDSGETYYVYHTISTSGFRERTRQETVTLIISLNCVLLLALMIWLARRLSGVVLKPVAALSEMAAGIDEQRPGQYFPITRETNEVGEVARTLQQSIERIQQLHERERQFLRQASHELRTPIAVISSALDVVYQRQRAGRSDFERPLKDLSRASNDMRSLVDALLWLDRADTAPPEKTPTLISAEIADVVADQRYLLESKGVEVSICVPPDEQIDVEQPYFRIVLNNLVRNAFEHSDKGNVVITWSDGVLEVRNVPSVSESAGFGIGVSVVEAIARKFLWDFSLRREATEVVACLKLSAGGDLRK